MSTKTIKARPKALHTIERVQRLGEGEASLGVLTLYPGPTVFINQYKNLEFEFFFK